MPAFEIESNAQRKYGSIDEVRSMVRIKAVGDGGDSTTDDHGFES